MPPAQKYSPNQVLTPAARAAAKQLNFQPPLVAARGAREGFWLEQQKSFVIGSGFALRVERYALECVLSFVNQTESLHKRFHRYIIHNYVTMAFFGLMFGEVWSFPFLENKLESKYNNSVCKKNFGNWMDFMSGQARSCQTLPGLPRAARPSGRFAEGKTPQRGVYRIYFGLNMRQARSGQGSGKVWVRFGQGWGKVRTKSKVGARSGQAICDPNVFYSYHSPEYH